MKVNKGIRPIDPKKIINGNLEDFSGLIRNMDHNYIVFNSDGKNCYLYLIDKDKFVSIPNYTEENSTCSLLLRSKENVIYRAKNKGEITSKEEYDQLAVFDLYYFNLKKSKGYPLYLLSENNNELPDTIVLSESNDFALIISPSKALLYEIKASGLTLKKEVKFNTKFEKAKLFSKELEIPYVRKPSDTIIEQIGEIEISDTTITYKDPRTFDFADGEYRYSIKININTQTYEEVLEK